MVSRLGIDVGGTFTDFLLSNDSTGDIHLLKTPTTAEDQSVAVLAGIEKIIAAAGVPASEIAILVHGTTVSANTILEQKGARVGLLVTENFEQVLHMARSRTPGPLAGWKTMVKPDPLADLELTRGVAERIDARGGIVKPLDEEQARAAIAELAAAGVESICVSLLHSYANPAHEQRLEAIAREVGVDLPVTLSSNILSECREYERTLVTVMNAYVGPRAQSYLAGLQGKLGALQVSPRVQVGRSDGGTMSVARAAESPVQTILSSLAGGVSGAARIASLAGHSDALGLDMGGTSTDLSLIRDAVPTVSRHAALGGYPINLPSVEVHGIGAGGGSIAHVPITGALRVGPESAGADPGPACYGGGGAATLTDANLVLGRLPPALLGGDMALDAGAAEDAIARIGRRLGLDTDQAAQGILDIVNETIFGALRLATARNGLDLRELALIAYGGAGPLHGNAVAMVSGCYPVIVPPTPGVLSAFGLLSAAVRNEFSRTRMCRLDDADSDDLVETLSDLGRRAESWLRDEGIESGEQDLRHEADLRYLDRGHECALDLDPASLRNGGLDDLRQRFSAAHERQYGFRLDHPVELVTLRVVGGGPVDTAMPVPQDTRDSDASSAIIERRRVFFEGRFMATDIYDRALLSAGHRMEGPAVVTQIDSTTVIHPRHSGEVDPYLNIVIRPEDA
ncbi:MAG: hydantoinase/oxoprolinase family protein [Alphaproteobacteria bacterium]|nr:hydantoinase/oxoprolinase family protein [Alphaproteobacteria bacterium]MDP6517852.1 hydantoinase/oxoprolinase family protein [Alphaproteobacteria bacterium]